MEKLCELLGLDLDEPAVRQRPKLALALRRLA
jgi:hypothetical protein